MRRVLTTGAVLALSATSAIAGGVERSTQSTAIMFERGEYAEFSFSVSAYDLENTTGTSGDIQDPYTNFSFGYKRPLNDRLELGVIVDQPYGASPEYPATATNGFAGSYADIDALSVTGLLRYKLENNVSLVGGLRAQAVKGEIVVPGYALTTDKSYGLGYVLGVAWENPAKAQRVSLTYNSAITHDFDASEGASIGAVTPTGSFETDTPQSVNLEFQSGVAPGTLVFGSIRWVDWTEYNISPPGFPANPLSSYASDTITYRLGVGRRFNDTWSGAVTLGHEPKTGDPTSPLGPRDGFTSLGVAATYTQGNMKLTGGLTYVWLGDATTTPASGSQNFTGSGGPAAGFRIGYTF